MQACKVGSSETHNLREKQLLYVVPEMSHLNESVIHEHIPDALARIEAKYTEVTGQRIQPTATPLKEAVLVIREDTTMEQVEKFGNSAVRNSVSLRSSSISTATKVTTTVPQRSGSRTYTRISSLTALVVSIALSSVQPSSAKR